MSNPFGDSPGWETDRALEWIREHVRPGACAEDDDVGLLAVLLRDCWAGGWSEGWDLASAQPARPPKST